MNISFLKYLKNISSPSGLEKTFDEYMFSQIFEECIKVFFSISKLRACIFPQIFE